MEANVIEFFNKMGFYNKEYFELIKNNTTIVDEPYDDKSLTTLYQD